PIHKAQVEQYGDTVADVADRLTVLCNGADALVQENLSAKSFSDLVAAHPNQTERGAYAVTLVTSLINDGNFDLAYLTASKYSSGELYSCHILPSSSGKSFQQLALEWLEAGKHSTRSLHAAAGVYQFIQAETASRFGLIQALCKII